MPEQFKYPEEGWSTGRMRKAGDQQMAKAGPRGDPGKEYRELEGIRKKKEQIISQAAPMGQMSPEDFNKYWQGGWSVTGKAHKLDPNSVDPSGTIIENDHPQIQELQQNGWESFQIPDERWGKGHILMRPPQDNSTPVGQTQMGTGVA